MIIGNELVLIDDEKLCPFQMKIYRRWDGKVITVHRICRYDCITCGGVID